MISRVSPVWQLYRAYRRSEGERLVQRLRELERPHRLLRTHVAALHEALPQNRAGGVALPLADVPLGSTERRILGDFERAVHGLLASTATLEASIQAVATSAPRSRALSRWYQTERGRRGNEAAGLAFADQLRDVVLASGRVPWMAPCEDTTLARVDLHRDGLRRLRVWQGSARDFIRGAGPNLDPEALLTPYAAMWSTLYEDFVRRAKALHRVELDERKALWDQLWWELRRVGEEGESG